MQSFYYDTNLGYTFLAVASFDSALWPFVFGFLLQLYYLSFNIMKLWHNIIVNCGNMMKNGPFRNFARQQFC